MNVLLVCSAGITTNILAAKLQKYAADNGKEDFFTATRVGQYHEMLPHADVVLIAPQASLLAEQLKGKAKEQGVPCQVLTEETFVLGNTEKIYAWLETCRTAPKAKPEPIRLTLPLLGEILRDSALYSIPVLLFGLACRLAATLLSSPILADGANATFSLLILYFMFSVGYQYGTRAHLEPVARGLIAMGAPLLMLPVEGLAETWSASFRVAHGLIPLAFFALPNALFLAALAVGAVWLTCCLDKVKLPASIATLPMMEAMVKMGVVSALFIVLRLSLSFL